jgi:hypothetical protein
MSDCKHIRHVAFKQLNTFDICGKQCILDPIYVNLETKNIEIRHVKGFHESVNQSQTYNDSKIIDILGTKSKVQNENIKPKKYLMKRVIASSNEWQNIDSDNLDINNQYNFIKDRNNITDIVSTELRKKLYSYKSQDKRKNIYNDNEFVDIEFILNLFDTSKLKCYYCECNVFILYDIVRELKQWTVERIDNRLGHNKGNSVISCLECNLRRRTMYHENYLMTKQLRMTKI